MSVTFLADLSTAGLIGYSVAPQTISSATTVNGTGVDCLNGDGPVHGIFTTGNCGDGSTVITCFLEESTDNSTFTAITGASTVLAASTTANDNLAFVVSSSGNRTKRYVRANVTTLGGTPSVIISGCILTRKHISGSGTGTQTT